MDLIPQSIKKRTLFEGDKVLWMVLLFLCFISIIEVYSASSNMSYKSGRFWMPVVQHTILLAMGGFTAFLIHKIHCRYFKLIPLLFFPLSVFMLLFALFTEKVNGASRWVDYGFVSFQPSEIAKGALITTVALLLASMRDENGATKTAFKTILVMTGIICGLIVPENFSTAGITFLVILFMMFVGRVPWKQFGTLLAGLLLVGGTAYAVLRYTPDATIAALGEKPLLHRLPTWANRVRNHTAEPINPKEYDIKTNPQVTHARIAIATCGVTGKGPGKSVERDFLPQAFSDFIYAIIFEELGLLGGTFVLFLYLVLLYRAMRIAGRCEKNFPAFLVMGLALMLVTQALVNMAVAVGVFPVTGQPLPLISKGGTSTIINCAYIGVMLSVSRSAKKRSDLPESELQGEPVKSV